MGLSLVTYALAKKQCDKAMIAAIAAANAYTDDKLSHIISFEIEIVDELPPLSEADTHTIYFLPRTSPSGEADSYYEYLVINNQWEIIGSTELDLSNYWTIDQIKAYVQSQEYTLPIATTTTLGGVKLDGTTITSTLDGVISVVDSNIEDISKAVIEDTFSRVTEEQIDDLFD
jgi:hypothetical protein